MHLSVAFVGWYVFPTYRIDVLTFVTFSGAVAVDHVRAASEAHHHVEEHCKNQKCKKSVYVSLPQATG